MERHRLILINLKKKKIKMKTTIKVFLAIILMIGLSLTLGTVLNLMFSLCFYINFKEIQTSSIWVLYFVISLIIILASFSTEYDN